MRRLKEMRADRAVYVDGVLIGKSPATLDKVAVGAHQVEVGQRPEPLLGGGTTKLLAEQVVRAVAATAPTSRRP